MTTTSIKQPARSGATSGSPAWSNPGYLLSSDNARSSVTVPDGEESGTLLASKFGFYIPPDSTLEGVEVIVERRASAGSAIMDATISLVDDAGEPIGDNAADLVNYWPTTEATKTYGSSTDLWNADLTLAIVGHDQFGVAIVVRNEAEVDVAAEVDAVWITVYYTPPEAHVPVETLHPEGTILKKTQSGQAIHPFRRWK